MGLNFRGFFNSLGPSERSTRPNRVAMTPNGQQNQSGPLKLLVSHKKTGKNTDFDLAQHTKTRFFSGTLCNLVWGYVLLMISIVSVAHLSMRAPRQVAVSASSRRPPHLGAARASGRVGAAELGPHGKIV